MLAGPNLPATPGSSESMGTTTEEPQVVPEKKMRSADDASSVESEKDLANEIAATALKPDRACAPGDVSEEVWAKMTYKQRKHWRQRHPL